MRGKYGFLFDAWSELTGNIESNNREFPRHNREFGIGYLGFFLSDRARRKVGTAADADILRSGWRRDAHKVRFMTQFVSPARAVSSASLGPAQ